MSSKTVEKAFKFFFFIIIVLLVCLVIAIFLMVIKIIFLFNPGGVSILGVKMVPALLNP